MRIYTWHSVFCIDLHTFVNSSVNPSSFERAQAMVINSLYFLSLLLVILFFLFSLSLTDLSAQLLYHEKCV
uniref:Uncharacterized protein n=1 Tax=Pongo abelii TaxID=9601 RepID=A0A8I5UMZ9_PONAB